MEQTAKSPLITSKERIIGIDIVKIVAMFLVTLLHVTGVGGAVDTATNPVTKFLLCSVNGLSFCCINLFALSTGFLCYGKKNRVSRLLQLWIQVVFWSVFANIIPAIYKKDFSILLETPFVRLFVISFCTYWYFVAYFALFFFIPILNSAIDKISEKQFWKLLAIFSVLLGILPFLFNNDLFKLDKGYSFAWLMFLYLVGAGIRKFDINNRIKVSVSLITSVILFILQSFVTYFCKTTKATFFEVDYSEVYCHYNFIVVALLSVMLFVLVSKIKVKSIKLTKVLTLFSSVAFSVYLIQCNRSVWNEFFESKKFAFIGNFSPIISVLAAIGTSFAIYLAFSILGIIQNKLFKLCRINILCDKIEKLVRKTFDWFYKSILLKCFSK